MLLGPDNTQDRHDTPFYTFHAGDKFTTPGVEVHANTLNTLLTGDFLGNGAAVGAGCGTDHRCGNQRSHGSFVRGLADCAVVSARAV